LQEKTRELLCAGHRIAQERVGTSFLMTVLLGGVTEPSLSTPTTANVYAVPLVNSRTTIAGSVSG